ncbi:hypothetical protein EMWEY_00046920 [Eimeria maxima]|uniref:Uncharacterized protein n=1 Tax=Eimeria maxima TaxID=5804 RepID=U6MCK9_EIMMA|nr:hypothetical protein EMWEY_00046920 [Eimeria maxima]CDJ61967.1 hypothetical protein EMWEY_00046920 [Eimeria maxima]
MTGVTLVDYENTRKGANTCNTCREQQGAFTERFMRYCTHCLPEGAPLTDIGGEEPGLPSYELERMRISADGAALVSRYAHCNICRCCLLLDACDGCERTMRHHVQRLLDIGGEGGESAWM